MGAWSVMYPLPRLMSDSVAPEALASDEGKKSTSTELGPAASARVEPVGLGGRTSTVVAEAEAEAYSLGKDGTGTEGVTKISESRENVEYMEEVLYFSCMGLLC